KPSLWDSEANRKKVIALWRKLAQRYANEPFIGGYDIINEPNWGFDDPLDTKGTKEKSNKPLRTLMTEITAAIREVDKKHIIIIEGNGFGNNYNGIFPLWDDNIVVSFHKYGNFNTKASIQNLLNWQDQYNVPLWLGESGENSNTWFTEAIQLVETRNIGWCWWQLKKMGISNPLEIKETPSYQLLLDYWLKNGRKPSPEEAQAALNEWLENIKIRNNIYHRDVIDAMFRQVSSAQAIPFKKHDITNGAVINAVDFDLGRNGSAYKDNDTCSYHYVSPPVSTTGNRGRAYRNDGVDIQEDSLGYEVFSIEDGEWLQYTVDVVTPGVYDIAFVMAPGSNEGRLSLLCNDKPVAADVAVNSTVVIKNIQLKAGQQQLRVLADKGGFNFTQMRFVRP
ncbi:MAG: cellulase family glycosylhydrolase, partial [Bacteroidota bacterium]